ncbi:hypothetical protein GCM10023259_050100 [Thermocatellispora tengchongensis]
MPRSWSSQPWCRPNGPPSGGRRTGWRPRTTAKYDHYLDHHILPADGPATMVLTAAYTGMRWGEQAGLAPANCRLEDGYPRIDPEVGACTRWGGRCGWGRRRVRPRCAGSICRRS